MVTTASITPRPSGDRPTTPCRIRQRLNKPTQGFQACSKLRQICKTCDLLYCQCSAVYLLRGWDTAAAGGLPEPPRSSSCAASSSTRESPSLPRSTCRLPAASNTVMSTLWSMVRGPALGRWQGIGWHDTRMTQSGAASVASSDACKGPGIREVTTLVWDPCPTANAQQENMLLTACPRRWGHSAIAAASRRIVRVLANGRLLFLQASSVASPPLFPT